MEQIGTMELLRKRVYTTESGEMAVEPGTYPVMRHADQRISLLLTGRSNRHTPGSFDVLGDGMFAVQPGGDRQDGAPVDFPYGYWSPEQFADLLTWEGCIDGHPEQRLRFTLTEAPGLARHA